METYLSSFIEGIATHVKADNRLHVRLLQHRTSTGRLSGADPNMQNMPRGGTFPVKKVFVSRWNDNDFGMKGYVLEADFAQLEFKFFAFCHRTRWLWKRSRRALMCMRIQLRLYLMQVNLQLDKKQKHTPALYGASGFGDKS